MRLSIVRGAMPWLLAASLATAALAQQPTTPTGARPAGEEFQNLKVLPRDIPPAQLRALMNSFTRALGVRCIYCHVGQEGRPFRADEFKLDDKPTKIKARAMLKMVQDINQNYLANLEQRADPPIRVECITCHRGAPQPRSLQSVLERAYATGGLDSTLARYRSLRERYYGRFAYDFGEVPLADVADSLMTAGHATDAESLLAMNVTLNPASAFARRQYASIAILEAFHQSVPQGAAAIHDLRARFGETVVSEQAVNAIGYELLGRKEDAAALAAFRQNVADHPSSGNTYDSLGEALMGAGDRKGAIEAYARSVALDSTNTNAKQKLEELRHPSARRMSGGK